MSPKDACSVQKSPENARGVQMSPENALPVQKSPGSARGVQIPPGALRASESRPKIGGVQIPPDNALGAQMSPEPFTAHESRPEATGTRRQPSSRMQFRQGNLDRATQTGQLKQTSPSPLRYRKCYSQLHCPFTNTGTSLPSGMMPVILRSSAPIMKST